MTTTVRTPRRRTIIVLCAFLFSATLLFPDDGFAQTMVVRKVVQELFETVSRKLGREASQELLEGFGREGVEELLERAIKDGGEEAGGRVVRMVENHGAKALRVLKRAPAELSLVLDKLPADQLRPVLNAMEREPDFLPELAMRYGEKALSYELLHPGVGGKLLAKLGDDAISATQTLTTDQAGRLLRYADEIAKLPEPSKRNFWAQFSQSPARVLEDLENSPKVLKTLENLGSTALVVGGTVAVAAPVGVKAVDAAKVVGLKAVEGETETTYPDGTKETKKGAFSGGVNKFFDKAGWALIIVAVSVGGCFILFTVMKSRRIGPQKRRADTSGPPVDSQK